MRALKMNGTGNAFLLIDGRSMPVKIDPGHIARRAHHHTFDQVLLLEPSTKADARYRIWNRDGGEVGACGNGARCAGWYLMREAGQTAASLDAAYGVTGVKRIGPLRVSVDLGPACTGWQDIPLARDMDTVALDFAPEAGGLRIDSPGAVSMGNPHVVFEVTDLESFPVETFGPRIETDPLFPERVNAGFMQIFARDRIRLRVWERGAGLTRACGTGAAAAIVAGHRKGVLDRTCTVRVDGGELKVDWRADNHVWLEGAVEDEGEVELE
jgi:diaminopimelate epimerase